jgi:hypothetical protein
LHHPLLRCDEAINPRRLAVEVVGDGTLNPKRGEPDSIVASELVVDTAHAMCTVECSCPIFGELL